MPGFGTPFEGIDLSRKLSKEEQARVLRFAMAAEFEAVQLYQQIRNAITDVKVAEGIDKIIEEERIHAGEFMKHLINTDPTEWEAYKKGFAEVEEMTKHKHI